MSSTYPSVKINLNSIDKVKAFTTKVSKFDEEFDIYRGRYQRLRNRLKQEE